MTKEEFKREFMEMVVNGVYYNMPKDYRKSLAYTEMPLEKKYSKALEHSSIERVLDSIVEDYYERLHNYKEILGY